MMMPIYPGAPWVPKFQGQGCDIRYREWKEQMQGLLGVQDMTEPLKVNILMGALTGMAKRQVSVVAPGR